MFVGHALLAFALVAGAAAYLDRPPERALALGAVAGAFAALPDVDVWYGFVGAADALGPDGAAVGTAFWARGNAVHRGITHSLLIAPAVALAAACWLRHRRTGGTRSAVAAAAAVAAPVAVAVAVSGPLGGAVTATFGLAALALAAVVARTTDLSPRTAFALALAGLVSHPLGDLFTGRPPAMLYPLDASLVARRIVLHPEPTLNLLAAFGVELATVWAAAAVFLRLTDRSLREATGVRAAVGVGYAGGVLLVPAPTLDLSYPFVFTVLAVGALGLLPTPRRRSRPIELDRPDAVAAAVTGLSAITVAWVAYAVAYLLA